MPEYADLQSDTYRPEERQSYVAQLFDRLAPRYDRFNRWVSFCHDQLWRQEAVACLGSRAQGTVLDLAAGTGDLARAAAKAGATAVHVFDISQEMLALARIKLQTRNGAQPAVAYVRGSAHALPFNDAAFDAVVSGFAMRNVYHFLDQVLQETHRVLKPGGRFAFLELSRPPNPVLRWGFRLHMRTVMPFIGRLAAGQSEPFRYLYQTTMTFLDPQVFRQRLEAVGFEAVSFRRYLLGGIAVHSGRKPEAAG